MKISIRLGLLGLFVGFCSSCAHHPINQTFRNLQFGVSGPDSAMVAKIEGEAINKYVRADDNLRLSDVYVKEIVYTFCENTLFEVRLSFADRATYDSIYMNLTAQYGSSWTDRAGQASVMAGALQGNAHLVPRAASDKKIWSGNDMMISLEYGDNEGAVILQYAPLFKCYQRNAKSLFQ